MKEGIWVRDGNLVLHVHRNSELDKEFRKDYRVVRESIIFGWGQSINNPELHKGAYEAILLTDAKQVSDEKLKEMLSHEGQQLF